MFFHSKFKILYPIFLFIAFGTSLMIANAETGPARLQLMLNTERTTPGSEVEVILLASVSDRINAFDISLGYSPEFFDFARASTEHSIVSIWQSLPKNENSGIIRLVGGMTEPYKGISGEIIRLVFKAKKIGPTKFEALKADFALYDGKGTLFPATAEPSEILITEGGNLTVAEKNDQAPKISEIILTEDPLTKNSLVMIRTENDGGVREVQMRSRNWFLWSDWQKADLLASVPNYAWAIELRALGWDNQESSTVVYRWYIAFIKLASIFAAFAILWFLIYKWRRVYDK